ncbi:GH-E family nuclease [Rathayibacter iranicus]|uniref:GH-E family nuclease n=1 Tax=Rathayibacter iranicus TaxID=59737 RepID=UPI003084484B
MSVVEFSADSWQASSPGLQKSLADRMEALDALAQGLESLAGSENISGQGADAMRAYIREVHVPIVQSLLVCLSTFQTAIGVYWSGYSQVDTDGNFRLVNDEYDAHLAQLDTGMEQLRGFAADLRSIAARASHLVSLDGAGASAADAAAEGFERMRSIAKSQQETWAAYEATDPGFDQVKNLLAELNRVVGDVGNLTVGQGRSYQAGSFNLTLRTLGELTGGMVEYCRQNQEVASAGWEALFSGYADDVKAEAERKRTEDALWGMLWDGLQVAAGVVVTAVGVGLTPFTGGVSLGLVALGGSLVVGGVNSAINHVSIATTGEELNLIGTASEQVGQWYDATIAQPAIASGDKRLQFLAGLGSGVGDQVSGALQMNVQDTVTGVFTLVTSDEARSQLWNQLTTTAGQVASGDGFVIGQIAGNLLPLGSVAKVGKLENLINKADHLEGLITKTDDLGRLTSKVDDLGGLTTKADDLGGLTTKADDLGGLTTKADDLGGLTTKADDLGGLTTKADDLEGLTSKADDLESGKPVTISTPSDTTSALDWLKDRLGGGGMKVSDEFDPTIRPADGVDGSAAKSHGVDHPGGNDAPGPVKYPTGRLPKRGVPNSFGYDSDGVRLPYANSRPAYAPGQVKRVWRETRKKQVSDIRAGRPEAPPRCPKRHQLWVKDKSGDWKLIEWRPEQPRAGLWDMGHLPTAKYAKLRNQYLNHEITKEKFLEEYHKAENYQVEDPGRNRSHIDEYIDE